MSFKRTEQQLHLTPGAVVTGKWNGNRYKVVRQIGQGANGSVYLAEKDRQQVALKVSYQAADLALEYKVLSSFNRAGTSSGFAPFPIELDDWVNGSSTLFFYCMEFIEGMPIEEFVRKNGTEWVGPFLLQLLTDLQQLHDHGYCFGDLKAENLLVSPKEGRIRLVDFGGVSLFGKSVREFTEWYDRGFWDSGTRRADPAYDLFACAQLIVKLCCPNVEMGNYIQLESTRRKQALIQLLRTEPELGRYRNILQKSWHGNYQTAAQMRQEVAYIQQDWLAQERKKQASTKKHRQKKLRRKWDWTDWSMLMASTLAVFMVMKLFFF